MASSRSGEKTPLCMEQYLRIFNAYRQPGAGQDVQVVNDPLTARDSEHVIVTGNKGQVRKWKAESIFRGSYGFLRAERVISEQ